MTIGHPGAAFQQRFHANGGSGATRAAAAGLGPAFEARSEAS